jgi:ribokinase
MTVVGSLNMDLVIRSPRIPRPGETIIGGEYRNVPGGKGANQAVAAARLGARVSMVGRVGSDAFGDQLLDHLVADGIDHTFVLKDQDAATGVALIVVDDAGADALLLQLESPIETVRRAAEVARAHGVTVILNPAPARPLPAQLLALVDVLIPNESETALLTGLPVENHAQGQAAASALRELGVGTVILTLGERGAMLAQGTEAQVFPTFDVDPVDTTAAGDAFVAGLAVALAEGKPMAEAVRWGNAAGALATTRLGAQPSLPTRAALEQMLAGGVLKPLQGDG